MRKSYGLLLILFLVAMAFPCTAEPAPENIILFIGDGMGVQQLTAGKVAKGTLEIERCTASALVTTWSDGSLVTDSAASATAMASGVKTRKGVLGQTPDGQPLKNVVEIAEEAGKATGVAVTCAVTHATPAGFMVHVPGRNRYVEIATQIAASDVDVLFGGGRNHFGTTNGFCMSELQRKMDVVFTAEAFHKLGTPEKAAALLYPVHPPYAEDRDVPLKALTQKAIEILAQDKDGFFLMVEGSQIDWASHQNDGPHVVSEVVDFDDAVGVGLDFAEQDGKTLVIVTADHETGGFAVLGGSLESKTVDQTGFVCKNHTASMVPLFAYGPGSEVFHGILHNTDIGKTMIRFIQASE